MKETRILKINKRTARRLYNEGKTISLLPCKCAYNGVWVHPCPINNSNGESFDSVVNGYIWFNCIAELGLYPHYFIEIE